MGAVAPLARPQSPPQVDRMEMAATVNDVLDPTNNQETTTNKSTPRWGGKGKERVKRHAKRHGRQTQRAKHTVQERTSKPSEWQSHRTKCNQTDNKPHQSGTSNSGDAGASRIFCSPQWEQERVAPCLSRSWKEGKGSRHTARIKRFGKLAS